MPHQCTSCGHVFADGSKEMLSGCPDCGGTKFQFHPDDAAIPDQPEAEPPERPGEDSVAGTVGNAAATVKNLVGRNRGPAGSDEASPAPEEPSVSSGNATESEPADSEEGVAGVALSESTESTSASSSTEPTTQRTRSTTEQATPSTADTEDAAQASARTDFVSPDELPEHEQSPPPQSENGTVVDEPDDEGDRPDLSELREELNEQFESIKVLEPGQYELNLMELYDREEYIIALQEDGKYSIQVPDTWED